MQLSITQGNIVEQQTDCLVVNLFEGVTALEGATGAVDQALGGAISRLIASGDFSGKSGTTSLLYSGEALPAPRVLIVGLGDPGKFDLGAVRKAAALAVKTLSKLGGVKQASTIVHGAGVAGLEARASSSATSGGATSARWASARARASRGWVGLRCSSWGARAVQMSVMVWAWCGFRWAAGGRGSGRCGWPGWRRGFRARRCPPRCRRRCRPRGPCR